MGWIIALSPHSLRKFYGRVFGRVLEGLHFRSEVIRKNIELVYPQKNDRLALHRKAYDHLGELFLEMTMLFGGMKYFIKKYGEFRGTEIFRETSAQGKGVIFLSSHVGNWEMMGGIGAFHAGIDLLFVTKHLKPEWLHRAVEKGRLKYGVKGTYEPKTMKDILRHLKKGGAVGIVLDQYAGPPVGVRVPFLGQVVGTNTVLATLAKRTGAPVIHGVCFREGKKIIVQISEPLQWQDDEDTQKEIAINTAHYARLLEEDIRAHPDQWLWTHRRFKGDLTPLRKQEWEHPRVRE